MKTISIKAACMILVMLFMLGICGCGGKKSTVDYGDAKSFAAALNAGLDLEGKVVQFRVERIYPDSDLGYEVTTGEGVSFVSGKDPEVSEGDTMTVRVTEIGAPQSVWKPWVIRYEKVSNAKITDDTTFSRSTHESDSASTSAPAQTSALPQTPEPAQTTAAAQTTPPVQTTPLAETSAAAASSYDGGYSSDSPFNDSSVYGYTYREACEQGWKDAFEDMARQMGTDGYNLMSRFMWFIDDCDEMYFTRENIDGFDKDMVTLAYNAPFAHEGQKFNDEAIQSFFQKWKWYNGSIKPDNFQETMLNDYEKMNKELIVAYEKELGYSGNRHVGGTTGQDAIRKGFERFLENRENGFLVIDDFGQGQPTMFFNNGLYRYAGGEVTLIHDFSDIDDGWMSMSINAGRTYLFFTSDVPPDFGFKIMDLRTFKVTVEGYAHYSEDSGEFIDAELNGVPVDEETVWTACNEWNSTCNIDLLGRGGINYEGLSDLTVAWSEYENRN